jgi:hypothetical protein
MKHEAIKNRSEGGLPAFDRYIGIDYSGAETPISSLRGIGVYLVSDHFCSISGYWANHPLGEKIAEIAAGSFKHKNPPQIHQACRAKHRSSSRFLRQYQANSDPEFSQIRSPRTGAV